MSSDILPQQDIERTPGGVAVMDVNAGEGGASIFEASPSSVPEENASSGTSQTNSSLTSKSLDGKEHSPKTQCGQFVVATQCKGEVKHTHLMSINCGAEWCPQCGQDGSASHLRRIARVLPKARQIASMGYLVIEYPNDMRVSLRNVTLLKDQERRIVECLAGKRNGRKGRVGGWFNRGLRRWHFFGDKIEGKYNPHLNILVDAEYMPHDKLAELKNALREATGVENLIVHYSYVTEPAEKYHRVRYITRATFKKLEWDEELAWDLRNFRNQSWWGKWKDEMVWDVQRKDAEGDFEALHALEHVFQRKCAVCGAELEKWTRPINSKYVQIWKAVEIGHSGIYLVPDGGPFAGEELSPDDVMRLEKIRQAYQPGTLKKSMGGSFFPADIVESEYKSLRNRHQLMAGSYLMNKNDPEFDSYHLAN